MLSAPHQLDGGRFALQPLVLPHPLHPSTELSIRPEGVTWDRSLTFAPGGRLQLNTAYNVFALAKWRRFCDLTDLGLRLAGQGSFLLTLTGETGRVSPPWTHELTLTLDGTRDLTLPAIPEQVILLHLTLAAPQGGQLAEVTWTSADPPRRLPHLALSITTYGREEAALSAIDRFLTDSEGTALADYVSLQVVDNGWNLPPVDHPRVRIFPNRNLGGAGGFARGLSEARAQGATHCAFMDDDASLGWASVVRTWTFLAHASDPRTAVAGALMAAARPTRVWENGALFSEVWKPISHGRDLARFGGLISVEVASLRDRPPQFYGGFWFYAFPLEGLRHGIFPFFVRGDDTSFCIANQFRNVTLPGVMSFQDQDFSEKESALTLYLDLRSNLIHHLTLPALDRGRKIVTVPARFFRRALGQHHNDTLLALNWAIEDVLAGPDLFAAEPDAARRRAAIAGARKHEVWTQAPPGPERRRFDPKSFWQRVFFGLTLNGALLPFFDLWGDRIVLPQAKRGFLRLCWGAARVTYVTPEGKTMALRHDKALAWRMGLRMVWNIARLGIGFPGHRRRWREGYARIATEAWWQGQFGKRD